MLMSVTSDFLIELGLFIADLLDLLRLILSTYLFWIGRIIPYGSILVLHLAVSIPVRFFSFVSYEIEP